MRFDYEESWPLFREAIVSEENDPTDEEHQSTKYEVKNE